MDKMSLIALAKASKAGGGGGSFTQEQADWNQTDNTQVDFIKNKPSLSTVATSGSYDDLTNKPTIPEAYTLPTASTDTLGGVKVDGTSITIDNDVIHATQPVMPTVDTELDPTSDNAIANSAVATEFISMSNDIDLIESDILSTKTTAKADIVSISDAQDIPAEDVKADIEPIQDLHGYDYPWVGGASANQWDEEVELGYYDSTGTFQSANNRLCTKNKIKVTPQNTYYCTLPLSTSLTDNFIICYDTNEEFLQRLNLSNSGNGFSFTTPNNCYYINVNFTVSYTGGTTYNNDIAINYPSTVTTYSPYSNICPISGYTECNVVRAGKNIFDENSNKNLVSTHNEVSPNGNYYINKIKVKSNTQYTLSQRASTADNTVIILMNNVPNVNSVAGYLDLRLAGDTKTITSSNDGYLYIGVFNGGSPTDNAYNTRLVACQVQIEEGNQATSYEPYQGQTYTVSFVDSQDNPMTVYSGTLDVTTGLLVVDKASDTITNLSANMRTDVVNDIRRFQLLVSGMAITDVRGLAGLQSDSYETISDKRPFSEVPPYCIYNGVDGTTPLVVIQDQRYSTIQDFLSAQGTSRLLYPLATPQTYNLTPTQIDMLLNNNVLSASTGKIQVKYQPANVIGELKKEINEVDDKIPTTPFDGKKVLFIGDSFMEGFGARVADGLDSTTNPITTPAVADSTPMRGWAKTFQERYPKAIVHNISIYGATIAYQNNAPSVMGQLTYIATNSIGGEYVVLDGGANDVFQGITKGSAKADDVYEEMNWNTMNYNTYQTMPCLEAIFAIFAEHYPTVRLLYVSPPPMDVTLTEEMQTAMDTMNTEIEALCEKWGVKYIKIIGKGSKNTIYSNNTEYYTASDKIHPLQRFYDETIGQIDEVLKQF